MIDNQIMNLVERDKAVEKNLEIADFVKILFRETYGAEVDELYSNAELRQRIRNAVSKLRESYDKTLCDTNYDDDEIRKAYMIAYYPYFIEPARYIMENFVMRALDLTVIEWEDDYGYDIRDGWRDVRGYYPANLGFFACGPCPELLGVVAALKENHFCDKVTVTNFDLETGWFSYQGMTRKFCEEIMPIVEDYGSWTFYHHKIGDLSAFNDPNFLKKLYDAQVFFIQNYLSHLAPENVENFLQWFSAVTNWTKYGALFIFIDLNYQKKDYAPQEPAPEIVFKRLIDENFLSANSLCKVESYIHGEGLPFRIHHTDMPQALLDNIFTNENKFFRRRYNSKFYFVVLQKTNYPKHVK